MFRNEKYEDDKIKSTDLFITCLGSEERSFFIYGKVQNMLNTDQILIFQDMGECLFSDIASCDVIPQMVRQDEAKEVHNIIIARIKNIISEKKSVQIDIDYSAMPSEWYCKLPELLDGILREGDRLSFWYAEGEYAEGPDQFETIGIESTKFYSGKPSFETSRERTHLIGVGYDSTRTQGILSILDPESFMTCEAYDPDRKEIHENVAAANSSVLEQTALHLTLFITDIEFMIAKLKGVINEFYYIENNDVILVPDGPKPLIFVMSMMPWIMKKQGITCLHIQGNRRTNRNVRAEGTIIGFTIEK